MLCNNHKPRQPYICRLLKASRTNHLSVSPERKGVLTFPGLSASSSGVVETVAFVDSTGFLACAGEAAGFAVLMAC